MENMIKCHNCGAEINKDVKECPYCGELNYQGAEKEYMDHLDDIKDSLDDLAKESQREIKDEIANVGRTLRRSLIIIGVIILSFTALFACAEMSSKMAEKKVFKGGFNAMYYSALMWLSDNEAQLNEMFDKGQYDEIVKYQEELSNDELSYYKYWLHYDFMEYYKLYKEYKNLEALDNINSTNIGNMLYYVLSLETFEEVSYINISKEEASIINSYAEELSDFYEKYLGISDESEIRKIRNRLCYSDDRYYINQTNCVSYVQEIIK